MTYLYVFFGGGLGAALRYLVGQALPREANGFPWATLLINLVGAFLIGVFAFMGQDRGWDSRVLLALQVGFCGGFTTFSSFSLETFGLLEGGQVGLALSYILASLVLCLGGTYLAYLLFH